MEQPDIEKLIGELEIAVDRLRSLYEQYFMGIEKIEPGVPRKDVERRIQVLRKVQLRNTALRFRFQMILQRFNTYQTHWQRICREIENGTYKRHLLKAQRRFGSSAPPRRASKPPPPVVSPEPGAPLPKDLAAQLAELDDDFAPASVDVPIDVHDDQLPALSMRPRSFRPPPPAPTPPAAPRPLAGPAASAARPGVPPPLWRKAGAPAPTPGGTTAGSVAARPPAPPAPAPPRPPPPPVAATPPKAPPPPPAPRPVPVPAQAAPSGDLPEERVRQIYAQYVDTKRRQNESTAAITYQAVAKSLKESGEKLRQKHGKAVDFEVAVKDGKTILKPVVKG